MKNLVLIPGVNCMGSIFADVLSHLPGEISATTVDCPPLESVGEIADSLVPQLPEAFYLLGYSFGGFVATEILAKYPERVQGLILIGTHTFAETEEGKAARAAVQEDLANGKFAEIVAKRTVLCFHPNRFGEERLMQIRNAQAMAYGPARLSAHYKAADARLDRTALVNESGMPVLVIAASHDKAIPGELVRRMVQRIPRCEFVEIQDAGHLFPIEEPKLTADAIVGFLDRHG